MDTPYDALVDICDTAIASTHKWERNNIRFKWGFRVLLGINLVFAGYNIAADKWIAIANILAVALMVYMMGFNKRHLQWILKTRAKWTKDLEQYQFDRMTYVENGYTY